MAFGLFDGGKDDEHNGVGLVEISKLLETQDTFFLGKELSRLGTINRLQVTGYNLTLRILLYTKLQNKAAQCEA